MVGWMSSNPGIDVLTLVSAVWTGVVGDFIQKVSGVRCQQLISTTWMRVAYE